MKVSMCYNSIKLDQKLNVCMLHDFCWVRVWVSNRPVVVAGDTGYTRYRGLDRWLAYPLPTDVGLGYGVHFLFV